MPPTYAKDTDVTPESSRAEIERILRRYGATSFMYGWDANRAALVFELKGRRIQFVLPMPNRKDFLTTETGRRRTSDNAIDEAFEQAVRQRWRALALVIKARLESVEAGIETFDQAFLANVMLPSGQTVGDFMVPQVQVAYETGRMPAMLPGSVTP